MDTTIITKCNNPEKIEAALARNDGYCPCRIERTPDTKCMCKDFRDMVEGECDCGLYFKTQADFVIYTKDGCPRCDILKAELEKNRKTYIESRDYPDGMTKLPVLVNPDGIEYDFKGAMALFSRYRGN